MSGPRLAALGRDDRWIVSVSGGREPVWTPRGELF